MLAGLVIGLALAVLIFKPNFPGFNLFDLLSKSGHTENASSPANSSAPPMDGSAYDYNRPTSASGEAVRNQWGWSSKGTLDQPAVSVRAHRK